MYWISELGMVCCCGLSAVGSGDAEAVIRGIVRKVMRWGAKSPVFRGLYLWMYMYVDVCVEGRGGVGFMELYGLGLVRYLCLDRVEMTIRSIQNGSKEISRPSLFPCLPPPPFNKQGIQNETSITPKLNPNAKGEKIPILFSFLHLFLCMIANR